MRQETRRIVRTVSASGAPVVALVDDTTEHLLTAALARAPRSTDAERNVLCVLVAYREPPLYEAREDGAVATFCAVGEFADAVLEGQPDTDRWCFDLLDRAISQATPAVSVYVLDRDGPEPPAATGGDDAGAEVIISHRGSSAHLRACLRSLRRQTAPVRIMLGYDQEAAIETPEKDLSIYQVRPGPAGPYVLRQHFGLTSTSDYLAFQDSDDVSLPTRIRTLVSHLRSTGHDAAGCHELRLDELLQQVIARRFPLDVNRAHARGPGHAQFFPTVAISAAAFRSTGGLSSHLVFGCDLQFHLRASFTLRMSNVDAFLYVRRRRENSLTTALATGLSSPLRNAHRDAWMADFERVRSNALNLEETSLRLQTAVDPPALFDVATGTEIPLILRQDNIPTPAKVVTTERADQELSDMTSSQNL